MREKRLVSVVLSLCAGASMLLGLILWVQPGRSQLDDAVMAGRQEHLRTQDMLPNLVGSPYAAAVGSAKHSGETLVNGIETGLREQRDRLDRWFSRLALKSGEPARDTFATAYRFHQDEVRRELSGEWDRHRSSEPLRTVPLWTPPFVAESRLPRDVAEMRDAQRLANLEAALLRAVAKVNGFPTQALELTGGWDPAPETPRYVQRTVTLHLDFPGTALLDVMRAAGELDGAGPPIYLDGLVTRPAVPASGGTSPTAAPLVAGAFRLRVVLLAN